MADPVTTADMRVATGGWWLLLLVGVLSIAAGITILITPARIALGRLSQSGGLWPDLRYRFGTGCIV